MKKINNRGGISLIVLVITIIVIIILAAAVILTISNNNPVEKANDAVYDNDKAVLKEAAMLEYSDLVLENDGKLPVDLEVKLQQKLNEKGLDGNRVRIENGSIVIIDPHVDISYNKDWTNQDLSVQLVERTSKPVEYKKETETKWTDYTTPITISTNCKLQYRIKGESEYETEEITNIDKLDPREVSLSIYLDNVGNFIINHINDLVESDATATSEYGCSGIKEVSIKIKDYDWDAIDLSRASYSAPNRAYGSAGSECTYQIKYVDNAGNEVIYSGSQIVGAHQGGGGVA